MLCFQRDLSDWYNKKHAECLQSVWNEVDAVSVMVDFTNTISVHISRLLKYVDQIFKSVLDMSYITVAYQELAKMVSTPGMQGDLPSTSVCTSRDC